MVAECLAYIKRHRGRYWSVPLAANTLKLLRAALEPPSGDDISRVPFSSTSSGSDNGALGIAQDITSCQYVPYFPPTLHLTITISFMPVLSCPNQHTHQDGLGPRETL
eukprot:6070768-Karenia_brevis.AAC.1